MVPFFSHLLYFTNLALLVVRQLRGRLRPSLPVGQQLHRPPQLYHILCPAPLCDSRPLSHGHHRRAAPLLALPGRIRCGNGKEACIRARAAARCGERGGVLLGDYCDLAGGRAIELSYAGGRFLFLVYHYLRD